MKKAIIYVRGHNQEKQELFCRVYAADKGYKVQFVTTDIETVNGCDILIVSNASRISRNQIEYHTIVKQLKRKNIIVESAASHDNASEFISLAMDLLR